LERVCHGTVFGEAEIGDAETGIVGVVATTPGTVTGIVGTSAPELTPRLLISIEPKGIPVRGLPPGAAGDVGVEDAVRLFDPEPHIPDIPAVSSVPEADIVGLVTDMPEVAEIPGDMLSDAAVPPTAAPVAGTEFATDIPPPS
jgi:hypothetical protein